MADKALSPEIIKLMDKIAKNPTSRLFVPLAEEYLKSDMSDEAILVLAEGIKNHPTYVAARVMLGKIYLQKKQIAEAKNEFERVIEISPENILASKKLAVIYQGEGEVQRALDICKRILMVDPSDKETKVLLSSLEKERASSPNPVQVEDPLEQPGISADLASPAGGSDELQEKAPLSDFSATDENLPEASPSPTLPALNQEGLSLPPLPDGKAEEGELIGSHSPYEGVSEPIVEGEPGSLKADEDEIKVFDGPLPDYLPAQEENRPDPIASSENPLPENIVSENSAPIGLNESASIESVFSEFVASVPQPEPGLEEKLATGTLAALYMDQGHFQEAAEVYKKILERDPSDQESLKGLESALQKLTGPAVLENGRGRQASGKTQRLQSWLDSIRKGKGE